jgi:DNA-binding response OmpR family regulator
LSGRPAKAPPTGPVLLVEDDAAVRRTLEWTLEAEGIAVSAAGTGRVALELAASQRPGLVLLDIGLPDMTGYDVADTIKATYGEVPIVVLTADGRAAEKAERVGAQGYLSKPFELDELIAMVKQILVAP